jgi:hypothetical protein
MGTLTAIAVGHDIAHDRQGWEHRRDSLRAYVRSNFVPALPETFGDLAFEALTILEDGGWLHDTVYSEDMVNMPYSATLVPPVPGQRLAGWTIEIGQLLLMLHLEYSIDEETVERINNGPIYEMDPDYDI